MRPSAPQQRYSYQLSPGKLAQAIEFNRRIDALHFIGVAWSLAILAFMIRFRTGRRAAAHGAIGLAALLAIPWIASLPIDIYRHWLALHYELSIESWPAWIWDLVKGGAVSGLAVWPMALGFFALARRSPRRWWFYAWIVAVFMTIGSVYVIPVAINPLFYRFVPLASTRPQLVGPVEEVARRAGQPVPPERIFEMNASEKTRTMNAYMTGIGTSKRIVIWDTAAAVLTPPQVQTVFAHELGHYALHHIPRGIAMGSAAMLAALYLLDCLLRRLTAARGERWQIQGIGDYAILPLAMLLLLLGAFLAEPVINTISRAEEHSADVYELEIMRQLIPHAGANSALVDQIMAEIALDDPAPHPFIKFWLYDHPATAERMRFAQEFAP